LLMCGQEKRRLGFTPNHRPGYPNHIVFFR